MNTTTEQRSGDWFQTYTGLAFYPLDPRPDEIRIEDISHALSRICRFGGHVKEFYSVAQHSVFVSHLVPPELALVGLLHDATEAYVGDMVRPLKYSLPEYIKIEIQVWAVIAARFSLPNVIPSEVKHADNIMLVTEARDLLSPCDQEWGNWKNDFTPLPQKMIPLSPIQSEQLFNLRFEELIHA
jgi:5'-deoxynucleotidase YfbR-like HD superfamily hydrolase